MEPPSTQPRLTSSLNLPGIPADTLANGTPQSGVRISVGIVNRSGIRAPLTAIRAGVRIALQSHGSRAGSVSVLLTGDEEIHELNRSYRSVDSPTDVLTFPLDPIPGQRQLGDIAISVDTARMQAEKRGVSLENEIATLAIHGALHLVGFDDEEEEAQKEMISAMNEVSRKLGWPEDPHWTSLAYQDEKVGQDEVSL